MPNELLIISRQANVKNAITEAENHLDGFRVLLFGSAIYKNYPTDIDLLFIYDESKVLPKIAYQTIRPVMQLVNAMVGHPVHPVVLSRSEENRMGFVDSLDPRAILLIDKT